MAPVARADSMLPGSGVTYAKPSAPILAFDWTITRFPILQRSPTQTHACSSVSSPIAASAPTLTWQTILTRSPTRLFGPIQQKGPIETFLPTDAEGCFDRPFLLDWSEEPCRR